MPDSLDAFQALVSAIDYPMLIVTAAADGERSGCLVGFATQASLRPPRLLVLLSKLNHTLNVARRAEILVVHFLRDGNGDLAALFGEETGDRVDKFAACDWHEGPGGTPVLSGVAGWAAGRILDRLDTGDHVAHLLDVLDAIAQWPGHQLGFQAVRQLKPGHPVW